MKSFRIEYFPDMVGNDYGKKVFTVGFAVNNWNKFKALDDEKKATLLSHINRFQDTLNVFKQRLLSSEPNDEVCDTTVDAQ